MVRLIRTLGVPEEAMEVAAQIWVVEVKDHQYKVVGLWVALAGTGVPLEEEEGEEEEVHSLREALLVAKLGPWDLGDWEFMEVGVQVDLGPGEGEVQEVGSNNRSREAGGETERQETDASQICHNLPIVISLSEAVVHWL